MKNRLTVLNAADRRLEVTIGVSRPIDRAWGREMLLSGPGAVDLSRLNEGAPVLFLDEIIGKVIEGSARVHPESSHMFANVQAELELRKCATATEIIARLISAPDHESTASMSYLIHEARLKHSPPNTRDVWEVPRWTPLGFRILPG